MRPGKNTKEFENIWEKARSIAPGLFITCLLYTSPLTTYKTTEVIKAGISRTFQNLELVYWLPIMDNMLIGAHAFYRSTLGDQFIHTAKLRREEDVFRQRALSILERLGIAQYKDMPPMGLPYGCLLYTSERQLFEKLVGENRSPREIARLLDINLSSVYRKLRQHQMNYGSGLGRAESAM